ncbi:MAG TPA: TIGR04086 family membrane protein [Chitinophagaceae bacterium]|nr:TIGR04086 family membrane protein [Chitinophagaceae bacterium]HRF19710.1 TIGR04086 family membrane protein [Chitinophagaceae bacterium]
MSYPAKEIIRNFLSVVAGVMIALIIILPIGLFAGLLVFSDSNIPKSKETLSKLLLIFGLIAGCLLGGYTTVKMSTRKDLVHAFITGIVLTFLYALVNDFEFDWRYPDTGIAYAGFIPIVMIGGIIGERKKRTTSNSHSSPPGTP